MSEQDIRGTAWDADPRFEPTPESPAWLAAMGEADLDAERWLEEQEARA